MKKKIPLMLIIFRLFLAPIIVGLVFTKGSESRRIVILLMYLGLLSDILDGIVARYLDVSSPNLRRFDSQADLVFWLSIGISTWMLHPDLIRNNRVPVIIIFSMEVLCYLISIIKFRKETCTHALLSKLWGVTLLIAFTSLIGFNHAGIPFFTAIVFGLISHADRILITLILPEWTHDIPSFYHAYLIRKGINIKRNKLLN
jgi:CDP-diacylglycerol--glycerol-3-phosphate 3-phosphatidyltransferase